MITNIKEDYNIKYTDEYLNTETLLLRFFSKSKLPESSKLYRRYIEEITSRKYMPNGGKKWLYSLAYMYEVRIPKKLFEIDVDECSFSYIAYILKGISVKVVNNTSAGSGYDLGDGTTGSITLQTGSVNHCLYVGVRDAKKILSIALNNSDGTINKSEHQTYFTGYYPEVMFISKYAPESTSFNKSTYTFSRILSTGNPFIDHVLRYGWSSKTIKYIKDYIPNIRESVNEWKTDKKVDVEAYIKKHEELFEINRGQEIIDDIELWMPKKDETFYGLPVELFDAMQKIKNFKRINSK